MITLIQMLQLRCTPAVLTAFSLAALSGCSGDNLTEPEPARVLTSVQLFPMSSTISLVEPLNTVALRIVAYDQDGGVMTDAGAVTFASADEMVARVHEGSTVSAVAAGQAVITTTVTINGVAKTVQGTVNVVGEREPALVGTWRGTVVGSLGSSNVVFVLTSDATMSVDGDASWTPCRIEGTWALSDIGFGASGREVGCMSNELTFTATLSHTQQLSGSWAASNGHIGTFSFRKE
jgi:hypothetical protein